MSDDPTTELSLIARQQRQLLSEVGTMRNDMDVMIAILQRLDGAVVGLVNEVRATYQQQSRLANRVRDFEG